MQCVSFLGHFLLSFSQIKFVCINVAICDPVYNLEAEHGLCQLLTASENYA